MCLNSLIGVVHLLLRTSLLTTMQSAEHLMVLNDTIALRVNVALH